MRSSDVVERLLEKLPARTGLFSNDIPLSSLTRSGSTVTAISPQPHGMNTGDRPVITGAFDLNPITSLTFADGIVSAETQNNHDLTAPSAFQKQVDNIYAFNRASVGAAVEAEYNGDFVLEDVPNRKNFTYKIDGTPTSPATGSPALLQNFGYDGKHVITVIDPNTFTYEIATTPESPASGTIVARSPARVSSALDLQRAIDGYTKQSTSDLWIFVILGDAVPSRNRKVLSDATNEQGVQTEYRARLLEPFFIYVFVPAIQSLSGRNLRDDMEIIRGYIYNSIAGVTFPSALTERTWSHTTPLGDKYMRDASTPAVYIHEFAFERVVDVTYGDTKGPDASGAFRDAEQVASFDFGTEALNADVNLDEQPV
ncbi:MAG: hypothetical protein JRL30_29355 [Deltaproteobacteria bacterium]|nr:hypothetical protein [Deltaproteobacteria bacterium]